MAGTLTHTPADVVTQVLIALGLGSDPDTGGGVWPVHVNGEPSIPDACLTVYDTVGLDQGRYMGTGGRFERHGVQVRVRAADGPAGGAKARAVMVTLDTGLYDLTVTIASSTYRVHAFSRSGDVIPLFADVGNTKRHAFTLNGTVGIRQTS